MHAPRFSDRDGASTGPAPESFRTIDAPPIGAARSVLLEDVGAFFASAGGYAQIALLDLGADHPARASLEALSRVLWRGQHVSHALAGADEAAQIRLRPIDLRRVARETVDATRALLPAGVTLGLDLPARPVSVHADDAALVRLAVRLVQRALDRVARRPRGRVRVGVERVAAGAPRMASIVVHDDGPAVDGEASPTTASTDPERDPRASLGVWFAARTADAHGGSLTLGHDGEGGTAVRVLIPRTEA